MKGLINLLQIQNKIFLTISILTMPKYTSQVSRKQMVIPNECFIAKPFMDFNCKTLPTIFSRCHRKNSGQPRNNFLLRRWERTKPHERFPFQGTLDSWKRRWDWAIEHPCDNGSLLYCDGHPTHSPTSIGNHFWRRLQKWGFRDLSTANWLGNNFS